jgi:hypothetical protein
LRHRGSWRALSMVCVSIGVPELSFTGGDENCYACALT